MKLIRRILFGVAAPLVLAVIAALSYRAMLQHRIATEVRITSPNGVNEAEYIEINGAQEWITPCSTICDPPRNNPTFARQIAMADGKGRPTRRSRS